jgi:hypothetical protein
MVEMVDEAHISCLCRTEVFGGPVFCCRAGRFFRAATEDFSRFARCCRCRGGKFARYPQHDQEIPVTGYNSPLIKKGRFGPATGGTDQEKKCWEACARSSMD